MVLKLPLGEMLANLGGFSYEGEPLPQVYSAVQKRAGRLQLEELLRNNYTINTFAPWYNKVAGLVWNRIYTTNIDNLLERVYENQGQQRLTTIPCPNSFRPQPKTPAALQYIKLHGCVNNLERGIRFSLEEFSQLQVEEDPWYTQLVDDIYFGPVIFVGTLAEESPLHHYLELRGKKGRYNEHRPASFLVVPHISTIRREALSEKNITAVEATGNQFFEWLVNDFGVEKPTVASVSTKYGGWGDAGLGRRLEAVTRAFQRIDTTGLPTTTRAQPHQFYLGTEATWKCIEERRDAARAVAKEIGTFLTNDSTTTALILHGAAGSGKTTILKRLAFDASTAGHSVYWANSEVKLDINTLVDFLTDNDDKSLRFVFVDTSSRFIHNEASLLQLLKLPRIRLVMADRTNAVAKHETIYTRLKARPFEMGDMSDEEIDGVIERLNHHNFLGNLKGLNPDDRRRSFRDGSKRQLLVALKTATSGKGFNQIIEGEFEELDTSSQLAYLIACLVSSQTGTGVYRKHLLASLGKTSFSKGHIVADLLRGVLVSANESGSLLSPRHRVIASHVCSIAHIAQKREAIVKFLKAIASEINQHSASESTPQFRAYRGLINSTTLLALFDRNFELIIEMYEELSDQFKNQFLFWLHYGRTYAIKGDLETARVFLEQAEGICEASGARSFQIKHQRGIVCLLQAIKTNSFELGRAFAEEGISTLGNLIEERGGTDNYPYVAYLEYVCRWYLIARKSISEVDWNKLRELGNIAREAYKLDERVKRACGRVEQAYLLRLVPDDEVDEVIRNFMNDGDVETPSIS
ncbi:MAG: SIR2 family protein [Planctomycetaceae bacterium]